MRTLTIVFAATIAALPACSSGTSSGPGVTSTEDAKRAYLGLDHSIDVAIGLGLQGFNAASNANIPPQTAKGTSGGTLTITGQVDQGASSNKTMNLSEAMDRYSDDGKIIYSTGGDAGTPPALSMKLAKIPNGTLDGTLNGTFDMDGDLKGTVTLTVTFNATLEPVAGDATKVERKAGTTHITGTANSGDSTYSIDVTR
jgi:hypothetical protein